MTRKFIALFFAALLSSATLSILATTPVCADDNWAFEANQEIEKSKRSYLLVYAPQEINERKIKVTSDCVKPFHAEGTYGKCSHAIAVYPTKKEFVLNSGEDVILLQSPSQKMILATLEYGCCGGPDTARFYAEDGTYLGSLEGFELQRGANYGNVIRRTFDMKNSTENYLLVSAAGATGTFEALVLDGNKPIQKLPVLFTVSDKGACDYWHIGEFVKYGNRDSITLKVKGSFCSKEVQEEQEFSCVRKATGISCVHLGQGK